MSSQRPRIYLDNAATSFPKPTTVYDAVDHYQRELGVAVGRGATQAGSLVQQTVDRVRHRLARLLGVASANHIIFTLNGTDALNLALHGLLRDGDRVIASCWEHNSVLRPLEFLAQENHVTTTFVPSNQSGQCDLDQLEDELKSGARLLCLTHASNVTGIIQPVEDAIALARRYGALVLLDAAQTVGHLPVSMHELDVDLLACPGHKGLLGPLGVGLLAIKPGLEEEILSVRQGGTGTVSESESQPETLPEKYESGNHNAPGIFGLDAALQWLDQTGIETIRDREESLMHQLITGLRNLPALTAYNTDDSQRRVGVVSLNAEQLEPQVLSSLLDEHFGIETRAGLHCSPRAHAELGTVSQGGTIRFSVGPFTTAEEIDLTLEALAQIVAAF